MDNYLLVGMLAVFVGLLFVQSRNRKKQATQMQEGLKPGAEVMLTSGIIGSVVAVAGDRVVITTAGTTKIEVATGAVLRVLKAADPSDSPETAPKKSSSSKSGKSNGK